MEWPNLCVIRPKDEPESFSLLHGPWCPTASHETERYVPAKRTLEAMRSDKVKGSLLAILEDQGANKVWSAREREEVVAIVIDYLTSPQIKVADSPSA